MSLKQGHSCLCIVILQKDLASVDLSALLLFSFSAVDRRLSDL